MGKRTGHAPAAAPELEYPPGAGKSQIFYIVRVEKTGTDPVIDQLFFDYPDKWGVFVIHGCACTNR